jgi:hypothetical protein
MMFRDLSALELKDLFTDIFRKLHYALLDLDIRIVRHFIGDTTHLSHLCLFPLCAKLTLWESDFAPGTALNAVTIINLRMENIVFFTELLYYLDINPPRRTYGTQKPKSYSLLSLTVNFGLPRLWNYFDHSYQHNRTDGH